MSSDELANVFRHSVAEVVGGVASGSLMLVLLLEEGTAMSDLLESEAARRALNKLPVVKALRLRRSTADYDNFRAMLPALEANAAALVGAGGAILWQATGQEAMSEEAIVREVGAVAEAQAAKTMQMMMGQMLGQQQQQQQPSGAPAATPSASACRDIDSCEALKSVLDENSGAGGKPVVVDFWSPACGPCMRIAPHFSSLAAAHAAKAVFLKVNAQTSSDVAKQYGVSALPTFLVFKNGVVVDQSVGADDAKLSQTVARHTSEATRIDWGDAADPSADAPAPKEEEVTPAAAATPATTDRMAASSADKEAQKEARRKAMNDKVAREQRERARLEQVEAEQEKAKKAQRLSRAKKAESAPAPPAEEKRRRVEPEAPAPAAAPARAAPKAAAAAPRAKDTARLSIKLLSGENHRESFPANATLDDVRQQLLAKEQGKYIFTTTYPRKTFTTVEEAMTLTDCGFVPSATLILQSLEGDLKKQAIEHPGTSTTTTPTASLLSLLNPMTWFSAAVPAAAAAPAPSQPSRPAPSSSSLAARRKKDDDAQEYANGNGTAFEQ